MEYARKLVYCKNKKDTEKFFKMLCIADIEHYKIVAKSITNQAWDAEWRNIKGVKIWGVELPFIFATNSEVAHPEAFYRDPNLLKPHKMLSSLIGKANKKHIKKEVLFDTPQHTSFPAGELFIWIEGHRGNMRDGYALLGIDELAADALYHFYEEGEFGGPFLKDGKLNLERAMPFMCDCIATELYGEDKARIIREVQIIDIDGLEDPDYVLNEFFAHNYLR